MASTSPRATTPGKRSNCCPGTRLRAAAAASRTKRRTFRCLSSGRARSYSRIWSIVLVPILVSSDSRHAGVRLPASPAGPRSAALRAAKGGLPRMASRTDARCLIGALPIYVRHTMDETHVESATADRMPKGAVALGTSQNRRRTFWVSAEARPLGTAPDQPAVLSAPGFPQSCAKWCHSQPGASCNTPLTSTVTFSSGHAQRTSLTVLQGSRSPVPCEETCGQG